MYFKHPDNVWRLFSFKMTACLDKYSVKAQLRYLNKYKIFLEKAVNQIATLKMLLLLQKKQLCTKEFCINKKKNLGISSYLKSI